MLKPILIASLVGTTFLVGACKPGYNRIYDNSDPDDENPDCVEAPISAKASDKTKLRASRSKFGQWQPNR